MDDLTDHNQHQIDYFSHRALPRMDPTTRSSTPYTLRQLTAVTEAVGARPGERVLDVGCGLGKYTVGLAAKGLEVEGLDLTPALVAQLHALAPDVPAHVGDLLDPPSELLGAFDVVTGFFVLHHLPDLDRAFAGVRALLRPGGRAAFCEPNPLFPGYYAQVTLTRGMSWKGEGGILRMRAARLAESAERAGLAGFTTTRFGAFPPALANRTRGQQVERWLEAIPGWGRARAFQVFSMKG
jgi:2-polyprenyl-3-methyl-5-hydroxy-6-metoxy-1,4-benzoquinol methylase